MTGIRYLKEFDKTQLWRFFVDGRFHKKYNGWVGYEKGERGSIKALLNGFLYMIENFDISYGLKTTYLRELHKRCMLAVETINLKSSPGDIRYLNSGIPFFKKTTTYEHLKEVFELNKNDDALMFNAPVKFEKPATKLDIDEVWEYLQKEGKLNYKNWYPKLSDYEKECLDGKHTLKEFYKVKYQIQMQIIEKFDEIIDRYNKNIKSAKNDDEKLSVITLVSRELELLHPFPDGNARTFSCILLNHLLMFNGFPPAINENPNLDNEVSHKEWIGEVKKGIDRTLELIKNPKTKLFNYSIEEMEQSYKDKFLGMAKDLARAIDDFEEAYLNPKNLEELVKGKWHNLPDYNMIFSGVGDYNTFRNGQIYFIFDDFIDKVDIKKLESKGIKAFVTNDKSFLSKTNKPIFLTSSNIKETYIKCATSIRQDLNPKTILVTGTVGKTGFKTQIYHILKNHTFIHANINSANTEIPVLRSLINLKAYDEIEINEVSVGDEEKLRVERTKWVNPDICVFTHIGPNHMDMHKSIQNLIWAKSSVVEGLRDDGIIIINKDMKYFDELLEAIQKRKQNIKYLTFGSNSNCDGYLIEANFIKETLGWEVKAKILDEEIQYFLPLIQSHLPLASISVLLTAKYLNFDIQKIAKEYESLLPYDTMGKMMIVHKPEGDILFYDQSRRGSVDGMRAAFKDLSQINPKGKIVALLGGVSFKKDSKWVKEAHLELANLINNSKIKKLFTTSKFMDYVTNNLKDRSIFVKHSDDLDFLAKTLIDEVEPDDLLFIMGSAYLYLGRVSEKIAKIYKMENFSHKKPLIDKGQTLYDFFKTISEFIVENYGYKDVSKELPRGYTKEFCNKWWYNKVDKKRGKQLFGAYFYFESPEYLFHIQCATFNLHIGLVKYKSENNKIVLLPFDDKDTDRVNTLYGKYFPKNLKWTYREWGGKWASIDCGDFSDYNTVTKILKNFKDSDFFQKYLQFSLKNL
jgi:UDP-N-acetylmuramyl pentapeptide synthase